MAARPGDAAIAVPGYIASQNMAAGAVVPAAAVVRRFSLISLCAAKLVIIIWGAGVESKLSANQATRFFHKQIFHIKNLLPSQSIHTNPHSERHRSVGRKDS